MTSFFGVVKYSFSNKKGFSVKQYLIFIIMSQLQGDDHLIFFGSILDQAIHLQIPPSAFQPASLYPYMSTTKPLKVFILK